MSDDDGASQNDQRPTAVVNPMVPDAKRARQDPEQVAVSNLQQILQDGEKDVEVPKNGIWSPAFSIKERRFGFSGNIYLNPIFPPSCCEKRGKGEPRAPPCSPTGEKLSTIPEDQLLESVFGMLSI